MGFNKGKVHVYVKPSSENKEESGSVIRKTADGEVKKKRVKRTQKNREIDNEDLLEILGDTYFEPERADESAPETKIQQEVREVVETAEQKSVHEDVDIERSAQDQIDEDIEDSVQTEDEDLRQKDYVRVGVFENVQNILELDGLKPIPTHPHTFDTQKDENVEDKRVVLEQTDLKPYTMPENKMRVIEAALFMSGQPLHPKDLGKLVGLRAESKILRMMKTLADEYNQNTESAVEIAMEKSGYWTMRVKKEYAPAVRAFSSEAEISRHAIKTLAYIYRNEGITKRTLFSRLGGSIYEDCSELEEKGFITTEPFGRTKKLFITPKFKHYFGV